MLECWEGDAPAPSPHIVELRLLIEAGKIAEAVALAAHHPDHDLWRDMFDGDYDVDRDDMAQAVTHAWLVHGTSRLDHDEWRELFDLAGFRTNDQPDVRPTEPLVLWRGATPEQRDGWSWTDDRDAAVNFASGWIVQDELGLIWRAQVEPERLLARVTHSLGAGFDEYVVDTEDLVVEPDGLWCRCDVDMAAFREDARVALDLHEVVRCLRR